MASALVRGMPVRFAHSSICCTFAAKHNCGGGLDIFLEDGAGGDGGAGEKRLEWRIDIVNKYLLDVDGQNRMEDRLSVSVLRFVNTRMRIHT
jgi:hypothetical protein